MKRKTIIFINLFVIFAMLLPAGGLAVGNTSAKADSKIYLPLVLNNAEGDPEPIISDTTEVLTDGTTEHLVSVSENGDVFTFDQTTTELGELNPGDVMVGDVSTVAPNGFLRKVTNVTSSGGQVVVTTEVATLEDAIEQGAVHVSKRLTPADIQSTIMSPGVSLVRSNSAELEDSFFFELNDVVLYDEDGNPGTTDDQLKANGSLEFAPDFGFDLVIRQWQLQELEYIFNIEGTTELEFLIEAEVASVEAFYEIAHLHLGTITVFVGPMPIVFLIEMPVYLRGDGSLSVGVTTSVTQQADLSAGLRYENGNWNPIANLNNSFTFDPPRLSASLDFKGYVDPQLSLMLYGVTGPFAAVNPYLNLKADVFDDPWWELYAGIDVIVGVKVEVLGHSLGDHTEMVIGYQILLAQATAVIGEMVYIPAGEFQMGCDPAHNGGYSCSSCELPLHTVYLDAFYIDRYEVTHDQYRECVEAGACRQPVNNYFYVLRDHGDHPVNAISQYQAAAYCRWRGERLPTEAEWEKAARGTDGRLFPWGNEFDPSRMNLCDRYCPQEWADADTNDGWIATAPVDDYPSGVSPYGVYNMSGNVWEWTADWYEEGYYAHSPTENPTGPDHGAELVARGGGFFTSPGGSAATSRTHDYWTSPPRHKFTVGVRCALDGPPDAIDPNPLPPPPDPTPVPPGPGDGVTEGWAVLAAQEQYGGLPLLEDREAGFAYLDALRESLVARGWNPEHIILLRDTVDREQITAAVGWLASAACSFNRGFFAIAFCHARPTGATSACPATAVRQYVSSSFFCIFTLSLPSGRRRPQVRKKIGRAPRRRIASANFVPYSSVCRG